MGSRLREVPGRSILTATGVVADVMVVIVISRVVIIGYFICDPADRV
jgi:hypothetical protein